MEKKIIVRFGAFLIRFGTQLQGFNDIYSHEEDYAMVGAEICALCRNCGSPTQTTDAICWRCRPCKKKSSRQKTG